MVTHLVFSRASNVNRFPVGISWQFHLCDQLSLFLAVQEKCQILCDLESVQLILKVFKIFLNPYPTVFPEESDFQYACHLYVGIWCHFYGKINIRVSLQNQSAYLIAKILSCNDNLELFPMQLKYSGAGTYHCHFHVVSNCKIFIILKIVTL